MAIMDELEPSVRVLQETLADVANKANSIDVYSPAVFSIAISLRRIADCFERTALVQRRMEQLIPGDDASWADAGPAEQQADAIPEIEICRHINKPVSECREHNLHCGYPACVATPAPPPAESVGADREAVLAAELNRVIEWLRAAPLESGYCCCGDPVEGHNIGSGHSPVDELRYSAHQLEESIRVALFTRDNNSG